MQWTGPGNVHGRGPGADWNVGAAEFVPSFMSGPGGGPSAATAAGMVTGGMPLGGSFTGMQQNAWQGGPGVGGWAPPGAWAPEASWNRAMGAGFGAQPGGDRSHAKQEAAKAAARKKPTLVVCWNLNGEVSLRSLQDSLSEIDFEPFRVEPGGMQTLTGSAFLLWFSEHWHAEALVYALDETEGHVPTKPSAPSRFARWDDDDQAWSCEDVPSGLKEAAAARMSQPPDMPKDGMGEAKARDDSEA